MFELRWDNHKRQIDGVNHQIQIFLILKIICPYYLCSDEICAFDR